MSSDWDLIYQGFEPTKERLREALCTLGNGFFATRGATVESGADEVHYPGTYVAGCYDRLRTDIAGRSIENEDLVNLPNWLSTSLRIGEGEWLDLQGVEILDYRQRLNLREGLLERDLRFRDAEGRTTRLEERRLVHIGHRHLAGLRLTVTAEDWSGPIELRSGLDGSVTNAGVERYQDLADEHLQTLEARSLDADSLYLKVRTVQSRIEIALAARLGLCLDDERLDVEPEVDGAADRIAHRYLIDLPKDSPLRFDKLVSLYTSRDRAISECGLEACRAVVRSPAFDDLAREHTLIWDQLWRRFDLELRCAERGLEDRTERVLRLHIFHLLQTCSPQVIDLDVGVPARGLHGEAYRGHIFWDELFVFPLLNLRLPEITRALLRYRYRRLDQARAAAGEAGFRGAMFPWQSGSNGREESQRLHLNPRSGNWIPDNSRLQRHVNSAIAYNVWQHYQATRDQEFLDQYGAEMILEIARFWASAASYDEARERYQILGVMGPDEYHDAYPDAEEPGLDNNAYTNIMAVWVLRRALELEQFLSSERYTELCERMGLGRDELEHWDRISRRMRVCFHGDNHEIISQFEGYDDLKELDWADYRERYDDIHRLDRILEAEGDSPNRYKASKQADVLMLFYLLSAEELGDLLERLGYSYDLDLIPRNIEYYLQRTSHGSTLSKMVHSWVMARADRQGAWELFTEALQSDVADVQGGTTEEGIHMGAMAGTVDLVQRCFTGIELRGDVLYLNPLLPRELRGLELKLRYRQHHLDIEIDETNLRIGLHPEGEGPVSIGFAGEVHPIEPGEVREFSLM